MLLAGSNKKRTSSSTSQQRGYSSRRGYPSQQQRVQPSQYQPRGHPGSGSSSSGRGTPAYSGAISSSTNANSDRQPSTSYTPTVYEAPVTHADDSIRDTSTLPPPPPPPPQASVRL
jgi:hypothetical protein